MRQGTEGSRGHVVRGMRAFASFTGLALALTLAVSLGPVLAPARADVTEPSTGVTFAEHIEVFGHKLHVLGAGVRSKAWFDVYAGALYVDAARFKAGLGKYAGRDAKSLAGDDTFFNDFIYTDMARVLVLHLARDVDAETMREALLDGLKPHMTIDAEAERFIAQLSSDLKKGQRFRLVWAPGWKVHMELEGRPLGASPTQSKALAASLLKIWFGRDPISPSIKEGACLRAPDLLR